ncbi:alkaline phosphatase [Tamlana fucoidanivorans]|uniref:Alkaline phosphatase n=1 Tax=Allotamlana fucoidanivorans TaxID=2583814 RepID=A0A5C4SLY3_9FLAO|nr:alkaline phosphatase [Tamlana fucoidanivorans]TNJ44915.1 alkaline phosphatase [Tamlana fucoidanivorans]
MDSLVKVSLIGFCLFVVSCASKKELLSKKCIQRPKNVILLISDGAGLSQISSSFFFKDDVPNYSRFNNIGLIKTSSLVQDVTDSAAGATAFSCGEKTYNGAIGVANDSTNLETIVEIVQNKGVKTGLIATSSLTHATPASFFAHAVSRNMEEEIALDLTKSKVDFFAGGGVKYFNKRKDGVNLLDSNGLSDCHINTNQLEDFENIKRYSRVGYLLASNEMPKVSEGRGNFLQNATDLAIKFLSKDNHPFFIMSEGSQIDWGGHQNDGDYLVSELIDFDNTIGKALDYAEKDGNTLVVVTSDHETGGFTLSGKIKKGADGSKYGDYSEVGMSFSNGGHSATLIPVFAYGPGAEIFNGIYENTEVFHKIMQVTGWKKK